MEAIGTFSFDNGRVACSANGPSGQGIFLFREGSLQQVIDVTDTLDDRTIQFFNFGREGLSGNSIAFVARFDDDNTEGLYLAIIPEPSTLILAALGLLGLVVYGRCKRFFA